MKENTDPIGTVEPPIKQRYQKVDQREGLPESTIQVVESVSNELAKEVAKTIIFPWPDECVYQCGWCTKNIVQSKDKGNYNKQLCGMCVFMIDVGFGVVSLNGPHWHGKPICGVCLGKDNPKTWTKKKANHVEAIGVLMRKMRANRAMRRKDAWSLLVRDVQYKRLAAKVQGHGMLALDEDPGFVSPDDMCLKDVFYTQHEDIVVEARMASGSGLPMNIWN